ncbi:MAG TPA: adenosylmethionine--8-amino-7-oxononanoate transaminase [Polyangiaceae bacterium]|nr:adenosylmethionine--8-amino-7-oxononanoate transaminase [Polyangiaceae bacterium]
MARDAELLADDRAHLWHPYASLTDPPDVYAVESASGVRLRLFDGRELVDGVGSWWSAVHGYRVPELDRALAEQAGRMSHVMLGGLTHAPAVNLATRLVAITPEPLRRVFFSDSGSVAVEVALKMAIQYWNGRGRPQKKRFLTIRGGYHGDTFLAMSVCDPVEGMHGLFRGAMPEQVFADAPVARFGEPCTEEDLRDLEAKLAAHRDELAAIVLEPVFQGASAMRFYSADFLRRVRELADRNGVLLVVDEIATGFGRTGRLFACEHAGVAPDVMCVGKALTGGVTSLAATLATDEVARGISAGEPGVFMHGPTFMGNPLACAVALASVELLLSSPWQERVGRIERELRAGLEPCRGLSGVRDVRVLGAIGVVELERRANVRAMQPAFIERGVWLRPFDRFVYTMPPYVVTTEELAQITTAMVDVVGRFGAA